jgi:ubiquinone/menaquinone biosynthesis C-methylase UbiE
MLFANKIKSIKLSLMENRQHYSLNSHEAYKLWSQSYDDEKDNLILYYDELILSRLIGMANLNGKTILDFGSGTGRNWNMLMKYHPARLIGCDSSPEMISRLKRKFSLSEDYLVNNDKFDFLKDKECDTIISTLVISHIKDVKKLIQEWNRVLKNSCDIIITDFHPDLFLKGGTRTFNHLGITYKVENFIHEVPKIVELFSSLGFWKVRLLEEVIDENVKSFYLNKNALNVYEKYKGTPFIYGLHLSRMYADKKY